jgi:hypothetical protein
VPDHGRVDESLELEAAQREQQRRSSSHVDRWRHCLAPAAVVMGGKARVVLKDSGALLVAGRMAPIACPSPSQHPSIAVVPALVLRTVPPLHTMAVGTVWAVGTTVAVCLPLPALAAVVARLAVAALGGRLSPSQAAVVIQP